MATTTMSYSGPADGSSNAFFTHTGSIPDAAAPTFFACYRDAYGNYFDNITLTVTRSSIDGKGNPNKVALDAQIFNMYTQGIAAGTAVNATRYAQQQATAAALAQVAALSVVQTT